MEKLVECVKFFKQNEGFERFMKFLKKNYEKHGYFYGNIILEKVTDKEKIAFSGFMKKDYKKSKSITINLQRFLKRLSETKFCDVTLEEIINGYFGIDVVSDKELNNIYVTKQNDIFNEIIKTQEQTKIYLVLKEILNIDSVYYIMINNLYQREENFKKIILNICYAINNLPKEKTRLAVFAAIVSKDPHYLDIKTYTGRLFILFLAKYRNEIIPNTTEDISKLFYDNNILLDDVSNMVLCYNIEGYSLDNSGKIAINKGLKEFFERKEPVQLTLYSLSKMDILKACNNKVLIVENPNVFTAILDSKVFKSEKISIVCTYRTIKIIWYCIN